jgi:hypothetical protein
MSFEGCRLHDDRQRARLSSRSSLNDWRSCKTSASGGRVEQSATSRVNRSPDRETRRTASRNLTEPSSPDPFSSRSVPPAVHAFAELFGRRMNNLWPSLSAGSEAPPGILRCSRGLRTVARSRPNRAGAQRRLAGRVRAAASIWRSGGITARARAWLLRRRERGSFPDQHPTVPLLTGLASCVEARAASEADSSLLADATWSSTAVAVSARRISAAPTVALSPGRRLFRADGRWGRALSGFFDQQWRFKQGGVNE